MQNDDDPNQTLTNSLLTALCSKQLPACDKRMAALPCHEIRLEERINLGCA